MRPEVGGYVKATYNFAAQQSGELSLLVGDIIKVTDVINGNWLQGEAIHGASGTFPANFVESLVLPDARMGQRVFVALADFPSEQTGDLELTKGDIILGIESVDENWWKGKNGPLRGVFPLSHVKELEVTTEGPRSRSASLRNRSASLKSRADSLAKSSETVFARALVDVVPQIEGELGFQTGDLITVTEVVDDDWFYGECHNKVGLVSTICVEFLNDLGNDSELGAGCLVQDSASADSSYTGFEEEKLSHINSSSSIKDRKYESCEPGELIQHGKNLSENSVPYTSENTRSHDVEITPYARTLYPFQAQLPTELSFEDNEIVTLIRHIDDDWIEGRLDEKTGIFPAAFVEIIVDCPHTHKAQSLEEDQVSTVDNSETAQSGDTSNENVVTQNGPSYSVPLLSQSESEVAVAAEEKKNTDFDQQTASTVNDSSLALVLHDFQGELTDDLSVSEGDTIEILYSVDNEWLKACNESGIIGLVPRNHIQIIGIAPKRTSDKDSSAHINTEKSLLERNVEASDSQDISGRAPSLEHTSSSVQSSTSCHDNQISTSSVLNTTPAGCVSTSSVSSSNHLKTQQCYKTDCKKPTPLPKPKLTPKPVIKPKPTLTSKPFVPSLRTLKEPVPEHASTEKPTANSAECGDSYARDRKVFSDVNLSLSLDNHVQVELGKANSDKLFESNLIEEKKKSRSGSFSVSDQPISTSARVPARIELPSSTLASGNVTLRVSKNGTRPLSSSDVFSLMPPTPQLNRSTSDSGFHTSTNGIEASPTVEVSQHSSMPPARPVPPPPKVGNRRHSFFNPGFQHEDEAQLINLDRRASLFPFSSSSSTSVLDQDTLRRGKRPPPRPSGPRVASVPSKIPLQPIRLENTKPVPHRQAPPAPGNRCSVTTGLDSIQSTSAGIPPRPVSVAGTTPPKRPPPRLQKSPNDLMRFSPEPVIDEGDSNADLVADLKRRLHENRNDIEKYEQTKQELEKELVGLEEGKRAETEESLQFVLETLQGLKEEEKRLKGNLFSVSPQEQKLEKAKLLAEQRATDERLRQEEEEKHAAVERGRRREKRRKVLQELLDTERDYLFNLNLCLTTFFGEDTAVKAPSSVDIEYLFGNMEEIADVSQRLLTSLESATSGKAFQDQIIGSTFEALAEDMKNTYAPYCRHHDDVIAIMEKYREIPEACQYFAAKVEEMRRHTNIFDVEAMLIKPVQRILKYPLLLNELIKCTEEDHPDRAAVTSAIRSMTNVATAINEYKRRKDLVFKYKRDSDQSFAMKIAKLNFHSIKKKSNRMRGRLTTNLGIGLQLRDENFEQEEMRFRSAEKAVKVLLRNIMCYMDQLQEVVMCQENLAADISDYYGDKTCEEVTRYLMVHRKLLSHYKNLTNTVESLVLLPLNKLVAMLNGPNNVIEKRFDKLLDYNNLLGRGKDEKVVQAAKNDYEAMNAQLLDELPKLYQLTMSLLKHCMAAYVRAQRDFMDQALKENCILLELPSLLGGEENLMENFNIRHTAALDQISMLSFSPRGFNPKMDTFKLDRRGNSRQSFDCRLAPAVKCSSQSDSQRTYLRQMYGIDNLYQVMQTTPALDIMDMAVTEGTLVGVIKDKDPMGGRQRWFVDDGANKGFVQSSILMKAGTDSSRDSMSIMEDMEDIASVCSNSTDETDSLLWLSSQPALQNSDTSGVTVAETPPAHPSQSGAIEYYSAEYPFQARSSNEVSLFAGQVVVVLNHQDLDGNYEWWLVDADGYQGYVPANYLRKM